MKTLLVLLVVVLFTGCSGPFGTSVLMSKQTVYYGSAGQVDHVVTEVPDQKSERIVSGFGTTVITGNAWAGAIVAGSTEIGEAIAKTMTSGGEIITQKVGDARVVGQPQPVPTPTPIPQIQQRKVN